MYQTYGFPPELFETMAAEHNLAFDWDGYRQEMEQHGEISGGGQKVELFKHDPLDALKKAMHGSEFLGYETLEVAGAKVIGIIAGGQLCDAGRTRSTHEHPIVVVLDKTPFYGEMGGQVGDIGELVGEGFRFEVIDTQVDGGFTLHLGHLREGEIALGDTVDRPGRRRAPRRASAGPTRPRTCCTTPCESTSASTPSSRARRWTTTCCGSTSPTPRPSAARSSPGSRTRSTRRCSTARRSRARTCRWPTPARPAR